MHRPNVKYKVTQLPKFPILFVDTFVGKVNVIADGIFCLELSSVWYTCFVKGLLQIFVRLGSDMEADQLTICD